MFLQIAACHSKVSLEVIRVLIYDLSIQCDCFVVMSALLKGEGLGKVG